jgi:cytidylate kinase
MIITIDGPAGSGKSTAARKLAARLEVAYLDTGAMYRAATLRCLQDGVDLGDPDDIIACVSDASVMVDCGPTHTRVLLDGHDVSEAIRTTEVNEATPYVSRVTAVREMLVGRQRIIGDELGALVTEGRDQGSVVFPNADTKFFLDATLEKRAERRYHEMRAEGLPVTYEQVLENLEKRDGNDQRQWAPLLVPGNAIRVDTTAMNIAEVVEFMIEHLGALRPKSG